MQASQGSAWTFTHLRIIHHSVVTNRHASGRSGETGALTGELQTQELRRSKGGNANVKKTNQTNNIQPKTCSRCKKKIKISDATSHFAPKPPLLVSLIYL